MGILKANIQLFSLAKKQYNEIFIGDTLVISQQAVYASLNEALQILKRNKIDIKKLPKNFDTKNKIPDWENSNKRNNINARALFSLLGAENVKCCDVSDYENPDFIIDLNYEIDEKYHNSFDNIIDIGTLEHIFDVNTALKNMIKMLRVNGFLIISTPSSNMIDHGFYSFSPTLFYDFLSINGFEIKKCFLRESSPYIYENKSSLYEYQNQGIEIPLMSSKSVEFTVIAKKITEVNKYIIPNQSIYAKNKSWNGAEIIKSKKRKKLITILRNFLRLILMNKHIPFFIHKHYFRYIRGKNIKKISGKY